MRDGKGEKAQMLNHLFGKKTRFCVTELPETFRFNLVAYK